MFYIIDKHQDPKMYLWMHVNNHKIQDIGVRKCIYLYHFIVNQYHTKSAISVFLLQKPAW